MVLTHDSDKDVNLDQIIKNLIDFKPAVAAKSINRSQKIWVIVFYIKNSKILNQIMQGPDG